MLMTLEQAIKELKSRIAEERKKPGFRSDRTIWMERVISSINREVDVTEAYEIGLMQTISQQEEIIKKLTAIIQLHGIKYPTIGQSTEFIRDLNSQIKGLNVNEPIQIPYL